jgi:hypothetical protein
MMSCWLVRLRRQLVALTDWCDRWANDCRCLSTDVIPALADRRIQIRQLRQIYRQQAVTVDRVRTIGLSIGVLRSFLKHPTIRSAKK